MGLPSTWVRHLSDPKTIEDFESSIRNSVVALTRVQQILTEDLESLDKSETSDTQFDTPNWEYRQAYRNGQRSKIRFYLSLLNFLDQKKNNG